MSMIDELIEKRRILVVSGTGGVGKTTLSAALAMRAALKGKKTVVITIDPAKRLATALGIGSLSDQPTDLTPHFRTAWRRTRKAHHSTLDTSKIGTLDAVVPDTRRTLETMIIQVTSSPELAERIFRNPIFQIFSGEFSGTNEYMALQKVFQMEELNIYDSIILDTPPSRNALAFLDAPALLRRFFDERLVRWLVLPGKTLKILERLTGEGFMSSLIDFASSLFQVQNRFGDNLRRIEELLKSERVGFLLVAAPATTAADEAAHFVERLEKHDMHFDGILLNRTLGYLSTQEVKQPLPSALREALDIIEALQRQENQAIQELLVKIKAPVYAQLPELARDVHSVEDLIHVALAFESRHSNDKSSDIRYSSRDSALKRRAGHA